MQIQKTLELSGECRGANDNLTRVCIAEELTNAKRATMAGRAVSTITAENDAPSSDMAVGNLDEVVDGSSSTRAALIRCSAETGDENTFEEAFAHCVSAE